MDKFKQGAIWVHTYLKGKVNTTRYGILIISISAVVAYNLFVA